MFTNRPNHRSRALNTDAFGMRVQNDAAGRTIDLASMRTDYTRCNVLVGNSTVFGVGASSDGATVSAHLQQPSVPCVNLSIRGGTSQQELYLFLTLQRHLPPVDNIILLSGVINISLAAIKATLFYPEFGAAFSEKENMRVFHNQYEHFHHERDHRFVSLAKEDVTNWYWRSRLFRWLVKLRHRNRVDSVGVSPTYDFDQKRTILMDVLRGDLRTWGALGRGSDCKVHYVLQPVVGWTQKPLGPVEGSIVELDRAAEASIDQYANQPVYRGVRDETRAACADNGIDFHDANAWFDELGADADVFTDICHLNDRGYGMLAAMCREPWHGRSRPAPSPPDGGRSGSVMLFNSAEFLFFFPIVTLLYFTLPYRHRAALLVAASCWFYMRFIPIYLTILLAVILIDYVAGLLIEPSQGWRRKIWLGLSLVANIGLLAVFKYYNFAASNLNALFAGLGLGCAIPALTWVLPLGLSFHTFQAMSYTIEVYLGRQPAERSLLHYALYVLFYPQLVAGPIERPQNLLHQFREKHDFDYARVVSGLVHMAWGLFKKIVVADRLALLADPVFREPGRYPGPVHVVAAVFFAFQIYLDFSGYSEIAVGAAEVMGYRLMVNFRRPYFAQSLGEFWRRWHISLSTWFKDYLYVPLGGNRVTVARQCLNVLVVFAVSGLWHGAQWTFIIWGAIHGLLRAGEFLIERTGVRLLAVLGLERWPTLCRILRTATVFAIVTAAWIFFRAPTVEAAFRMFAQLGHGWGSVLKLDFATQWKSVAPGAQLALSGLLIALVLVVEALQEMGWATAPLARFAWPIRWAAYYGLVAGTLALGIFADNTFIYFQF